MKPVRPGKKRYENSVTARPARREWKRTNLSVSDGKAERGDPSTQEEGHGQGRLKRVVWRSGMSTREEKV